MKGTSRGRKEAGSFTFLGANGKLLMTPMGVVHFFFSGFVTCFYESVVSAPSPAVAGWRSFGLTFSCTSGGVCVFFATPGLPVGAVWLSNGLGSRFFFSFALVSFALVKLKALVVLMNFYFGSCVGCLCVPSSATVVLYRCKWVVLIRVFRGFTRGPGYSVSVLGWLY